MGLAILFLLLLATLHLLKADLDPSWHFISEYEIGRHGWLMQAESWRPARRAVALATAIVTVGFLVAFVSIATLAARSGGVFGPDVPVGWPNRIGILSGCAWLLIVGSEARRLAGISSPR